MLGEVKDTVQTLVSPLGTQVYIHHNPTFWKYQGPGHSSEAQLSLLPHPNPGN
jgi:hypothetical protein